MDNKKSLEQLFLENQYMYDCLGIIRRIFIGDQDYVNTKNIKDMIDHILNENSDRHYYWVTKCMFDLDIWDRNIPDLLVLQKIWAAIAGIVQSNDCTHEYRQELVKIAADDSAPQAIKDFCIYLINLKDRVDTEQGFTEVFADSGQLKSKPESN